MNALARPSWLLSVDEYLAFEEQSDIRHEYVGGEIHAMAGASVRHALIISNIQGHLWTALRGGRCRVMTNDVKVQVASDIIYYPDIVVTCDPEDRGPLILRNPTLVVEVLSPSTTSTDRREKMLEYRRLPNLLSYLVIHQNQRRIEHHWRESIDGQWELAMIVEGTIEIPVLETTLTFDEIYEDIEVDAPE